MDTTLSLFGHELKLTIEFQYITRDLLLAILYRAVVANSFANGFACLWLPHDFNDSHQARRSHGYGFYLESRISFLEELMPTFDISFSGIEQAKHRHVDVAVMKNQHSKSNYLWNACGTRPTVSPSLKEGVKCSVRGARSR